MSPFVKLAFARIPPVSAPTMKLRLGRQGDDEISTSEPKTVELKKTVLRLKITFVRFLQSSLH
jgi:hypothetical protein